MLPCQHKTRSSSQQDSMRRTLLYCLQAMDMGPDEVPTHSCTRRERMQATRSSSKAGCCSSVPQPGTHWATAPVGAACEGLSVTSEVF